MSITISKEYTDALTAALLDAKKIAATVNTEDKAPFLSEMVAPATSTPPRSASPE